MVRTEPARRVLVTGANRGLGLGIAAAYAERGDEVLAVCRRATPDLAAVDCNVIDGVELTDDRSVARLPGRIDRRDIDVLICNAGINLDAPGIERIDIGNVACTFDVNALGCVRIVLALLPRMKAGSKIMLLGSMGLLPLGILGGRPLSNYGYRMSKAALISFGLTLGQDLRDRGIAVAIASPGAVDTEMLRTVSVRSNVPPSAVAGARPIMEAGRMLRDRVDALTLDQSPALDRDPAGNPAIPADILRQLQAANNDQVDQGNAMTALAVSKE